MKPDEKLQSIRPFPDLKGAALLMLMGWTVGLLAAASVRSFLEFTGTTTVGTLSSLGLMAFFGLRHPSTGKKQVLSLRPFPPRLLPLIVVMALTGSVLVAELGNMMEELYPIPDSLREVFLLLLDSSDWTAFLQRFALLVLMAPVTEELVFRGIFQFGLVRNYGPKKGVLASSVCFGLFHAIPWQIPAAAITGILLGFVVYRTGSIFAGMTLHAVWNLLPLLSVSLIQNSSLPGYTSTGNEVVHIPLYVLVPAAGILFLALREFYVRTASWDSAEQESDDRLEIGGEEEMRSGDGGD